MAETRTIHDPFLNKPATISTRLVDRLRGKYAIGPTLPNGEPEFGWRQHETPPIQHEAAAEIERLQAFVRSLDGKTIATRYDDDDVFNTFLDEGVIVASDILNSHQN